VAAARNPMESEGHPRRSAGRNPRRGTNGAQGTNSAPRLGRIRPGRGQAAGRKVGAALVSSRWGKKWGKPAVLEVRILAKPLEARAGIEPTYEDLQSADALLVFGQFPHNPSPG
jgi:hypothetical protein